MVLSMRTLHRALVGPLLLSVLLLAAVSQLSVASAQEASGNPPGAKSADGGPSHSADASDLQSVIVGSFLVKGLNLDVEATVRVSLSKGDWKPAGSIL